MRRRDFLIVTAGLVGGRPTLLQAQQKAMPVIGYLSSGSPGSNEAFRKGLDKAGYREGRNVAIEYRWADGEYDRLPTLAADLVHRQVAVIAAVGGAPSALAAKAATATIPIVFNVGDPVEFGLVASLNRPGGNMTGVANMTAEVAAKRLDLLHELVPTAAVAAVLVNPANRAAYESEAKNLRDAALTLGLQLQILPASTPSQIDVAFGSLVEFRAGALVVSADPFFTNRKDQIVALAARYRVPATYVWRLFPAAGGLMSYGPDITESNRLEGVYTGKILNGAKPADLPVQQAVKLDLVINFKTAKELGLTIPLPLRGRADEVIE